MKYLDISREVNTQKLNQNPMHGYNIDHKLFYKLTLPLLSYIKFLDLKYDSVRDILDIS